MTTPTGHNRVSITFALPEDAWDTLCSIAKKTGVSRTEALRRAISTEDYFIDQRLRGHKVIVQNRSGDMNLVEWVPDITE